MKQLVPHINQIKQGLSGTLQVCIGNNKSRSQLKILMLTLVCLCSMQFFYAQEDDGVVSLALPVRNSLKFNRYVVNPTFSFVREQNNYISVYNKREWVQFEDAPQTYLAGYSGRFAENIGAGIGLFQQNYGMLTTFGGILNLAYNARLERDSNLTFGLNLGVYKSGLNTGKVVTNFSDPSLDNIPSNLLLTVNPGINYGTEFLDFGVSINNLVLYNIKSSELVQDDPRQTLQAHVMYTGYLRSSGVFDDSKFSGLLRSEFGKEQTTISANAMLTVPLGIWAQVGYNTVYGGSAGLGLNITKQIAIEYNFEKALGDLTTFGPSHEITLAFKLNSTTHYDYSDDDEISGLFTTDNKRVLASNQPKMDAETRMLLASEAEARRTEIRERAQVKASTRSQLAAEAKATSLAVNKAKQEEQERAIAATQEKALAQAQARKESQEIALAELRAQRAKETQERVNAQSIAKADALAKAAVAIQAKKKAEQEAKEKFPALERANAQARAKVATIDTPAGDTTIKSEQVANEKLAALEKAKVDARAKATAQAKLAAEAKSKADQVAQEKLAVQEKAKEDARVKALADAKLAAEAKTKADQLAQEKLAVQEKAKEDARVKALAEAKLATEAKAKADQVAQEKLAVQEKAKDDARVKALAEAKLVAEAKAKADQLAQEKLAVQEKAKEDARVKALAEAKLAAEAKAKADQVAQEKLAVQEKTKEDARVKALAEAKLATEAKAKADQIAKEKLALEAKAQQETKDKLAREANVKIEAEKAASLAAEAKAKQLAEAEAKALVIAQNKKNSENSAKLEAEKIAKAQKEAAEVTVNATDANAISMKSIADLTQSSKTRQDELLTQFNELVATKDSDLKDLKEENDLSEKGIFKAPKAFKSITEENNKVLAISNNLDQIIQTNTTRISDLENLYKERLKIPTLQNDEVTLYYQRALKSLKAEQAKAIQTRTQLLASLKKIDEETEFERKRRIKRAAYNNEEDRFMQDRATLKLIKQNTVVSSVPLKASDFDFGEEGSNSIQIVKNVNNVKDGFYVVVAVHNDVAKRDEFLRKAVAAGQSNVDFFYDVSTSKYFIYYKTVDSIDAAAEEMKTKGNQPYNSKMSIIKIEN